VRTRDLGLDCTDTPVGWAQRGADDGHVRRNRTRNIAFGVPSDPLEDAAMDERRAVDFPARSASTSRGCQR
jgi:hypothetical protein